MEKKEATMKETFAKEGGAASTKHITVVYSNKRKKTILYIVAGLALLIVAVLAFSYATIDPQSPQFILEDLFIDPLSNSYVIAKLTSTNPSSKTSIYYEKMNLRVWLGGNMETEMVFLDNISQKPHEKTTWTVVVANNSNFNKPHESGLSFGIRPEGVTKGAIIAELHIQWKSGIFASPKFSFRVKCPVLLNLKDLTSVVPKLMFYCSHQFT